MKAMYKLLPAILLLAWGRPMMGEPEAWQLLPGAVVDSSGVFLNELVKNPTSPVPLLRLAPAPLWGQTNFLTREQVIELGRRQYPALETTNWTGPQQIVITRRAHQLLDFQLLELLTPALRESVGREHSNLEVRLGAQPWSPPVVPDEPLTLKLTELPVEGLLSTSMVGFELWAGPELIGSWRVMIQAKLWRDVPVARSPLMRGQLLRDADIAMERRDVLARHEIYADLAAADASAELNENVAIGQPILRRYVRERPVMHRGQIVDAIYSDGCLRISLKVQTLEEGAIGQMVRVRNLRTNRDLVGKVQNEDTIFITL